MGYHLQRPRKAVPPHSLFAVQSVNAMPLKEGSWWSAERGCLHMQPATEYLCNWAQPQDDSQQFTGLLGQPLA